jgi:hypothetical protein
MDQAQGGSEGIVKVDMEDFTMRRHNNSLGAPLRTADGKERQRIGTGGRRNPRRYRAQEMWRLGQDGVPGETIQIMLDKEVGQKG